jgi:hypothetical protein
MPGRGGKAVGYGKGGQDMKAQNEKDVQANGNQDYEKPEVLSEEVFETLALTCTKTLAGCAPGVGGNGSVRS